MVGADGVDVQGFETLTDKEKHTLRMLLLGHDAKSLARHFGLSVHTINERLRDARRKFAVSSSKEAARLLHAHEQDEAKSLGDTVIGAAPPSECSQQRPRPTERHRWRWTAWAIGGSGMTLFLAAMLAISTPVPGPDTATMTEAPVETPAVRAARAWLALVDAANWPASWAATGETFRASNTTAMWQTASEKARVPLGPVVSRTLVSDLDTPSPPNGYRVIRFRTDFANRSGATETLSLAREGQAWKVVGIYIE
jgi:DNA-binding CsgD family transcriptional regulator